MNNEARVQVEGFFGQAVSVWRWPGVRQRRQAAQWLNPGKRGRTLVLTCRPPLFLPPPLSPPTHSHCRSLSLSLFLSSECRMHTCDIHTYFYKRVSSCACVRVYRFSLLLYARVRLRMCACIFVRVYTHTEGNIRTQTTGVLGAKDDEQGARV